MRDEERRKAARRRWYYRNRDSSKKLKPRVPEVPLLSAEERKEINLSNVAIARAGKKIKSQELQRKRESRQCVICGGPVLVRSMRAKSCSVECAKIARRKKRDEWGKDCAHCGHKCSGQNKYCDVCIQKRVHLLKVFSTENAKTSPCIKRILVNARGYRCEGCGLDKWMGEKMPIEVHHIDGDSDNNKEENLQLICPNCHALTPTFRSKNRKASERRRRVRKTREFAEVAQEEVAAVL